jgi:periplasmic divalent cation tolerance protein
VEGARRRLEEVSEPIVVLTTVARAEDAEYIAREMVERRLAACVNVLPPITSVYRWQGEVTREAEHLLLMKTHRDRFEALRARLVEIHPYETPEVIALPVTAGHAPYLQWIDENLA